MAATSQELSRCAEASEAILGKLSKLLSDSSLSDFTIKHNSREWKVHRLVLALHSTVLQAACSNGFKESKEQVIDLSEEDVDCVGAFVYYLYNLNYDAALFRPAGDYLTLHVQLYVIADKYDMAPLRDLAMNKFKARLSEGLPAIPDIANAAICAYEAYGATTKIRRSIVDLAVNQNLVPTEITAEPANDIERAMEQYPRFCVDIAKLQQAVIKFQLFPPAKPRRPVSPRRTVSTTPVSGCSCPACRPQGSSVRS